MPKYLQMSLRQRIIFCSKIFVKLIAPQLFSHYASCLNYEDNIRKTLAIKDSLGLT